MRHAVYAGSFDPITNGHLWMIEHGSRLFDKLTVAIGTNPDKRYRFTLDDRLSMLREAVSSLPNVAVAHYENRFLVHYAKQIDARFILRGIRNEQDYGYERGMRYVNGEFDGEITSVFLMPPREYAEISSSFVKGLVGPDGWEEVLKKYVPINVHREFVVRHPWGGRYTFDALRAEVEPALRKRYGEKNRFYHNQDHVDGCLSLFAGVRDHFDDAEAAELAIWFHDAIYDPKARDNEDRSAELARRTLAGLGVPPLRVDRVRKLVLATKHDVPPDDADARLVADIDLASLAIPPEQFDANGAAIRAEYAHVPDDVFRAGRAAILRKFLERPKIYLTEPFAKFESRARDNLTRALSALTKT
jgi:pantetheine-phosphate adenylyltransferase